MRSLSGSLEDQLGYEAKMSQEFRWWHQAPESQRREVRLSLFWQTPMSMAVTGHSQGEDLMCKTSVGRVKGWAREEVPPQV